MSYFNVADTSRGTGRGHRKKKGGKAGWNSNPHPQAHFWVVFLRNVNSVASSLKIYILFSNGDGSDDNKKHVFGWKVRQHQAGGAFRWCAKSFWSILVDVFS